MNDSSSEREILAVESEFIDDVGKDSWRFDQLCKSAANPSHPTSKFGIGNKQTLSCENTQEALLKFHARYYKAFRMTLAVISKGKNKEKTKIFAKI